MKAVEHALADYLDKVIGSHAGNWPEYQYFCPFCIDRKGTETDQRKLRVNVKLGKANCHRCGYAAGGPAKLLRDVCGGRMSSEAELVLKYEPPIVLPGRLADEVLIMTYARGGPRAKPLRPMPLPREYVPLWASPLPKIAQHGYNYAVRTRGLDPAKLERFQVGYCPTGEYAGRLVFPVFQDGLQVYFTTRYCGDHPRKSLNPPNIDGYYHRNDCLMNYDACVGSPTVTVVEGPLDVLAGAPQRPHAGTMGKGVAPSHIDLLERLAESGTEEFVLGTDPDASREAYALYREMTDRLPKVTRLPLTTADPHDERARMDVLHANRKPMGLLSAVSGLSAAHGLRAAWQQARR